MTDIDGQALMFGATYRVTTEFSENNSGGEWWLSGENYIALKEAGWDWAGSHKAEYTTEVHALSMKEARTVGTMRAIESWETATRKDSDAQGCPCCGPPFRFMDWLDPILLTGNVAVTGEPDSGTVDNVVELLRQAGADIRVEDVMKMRRDLFGKDGD